MSEQIEKSMGGGFLISGKASKWENDYQFFNVFCLKTDDLGNIIWANKYGNTDSISTVIGYMSLSNAENNGAFISFNYTKSFDDEILTLDAIKTDSLGNISCSNYQSSLLLNKIDTILTTSNLNLVDAAIQVISSNYLVTDSISPINVTDCSTLGLNHISNSDRLEIFPNPTQGKFSFSIAPNQKINHLEIYNALGELIQTSSNTNNTEFSDIDIAQYPNGIYLIKIYGENNSFSSKVIKQ
jgi:hypothetical protein